MNLEEMLKWIENANEEESKIIVKAAVHRRQVLLDGGEAVYGEFSREAVEEFEKRQRRAREMLKEEEEEY